MGVLENEQVLVHQKWQREVDARLDEHMERLDIGDARMTALGAEIMAARGESASAGARLSDEMGVNTKITQELKEDVEHVKKNTENLVIWANNITGFRNVTAAAGTLLAWVAAMIIAGGVVWFFVTERHVPKKAEVPTEAIQKG